MEQQVIEDRIYEQARRAAKSALIGWCGGNYPRMWGMYDDLVQDLAEWYVETPSTQIKMAGLVDAEIFVTFKIRAQQILSKQQLRSNVYNDKITYSSDSIKQFLKGESTNKYLEFVLPLALERLNELHRESIQVRYFDGKVPEQGKGQWALTRAVKALTDMVNLIVLTTDEATIGSRTVVFPESIKPKGAHGDPTANIALTLMEQRPDYADEYLYQSPWEQVNKGAAAEPVIEFGPSGRYRLTAAEADLFQRVPGLIDLFIDQKQKEWEGA